MFVRCAGCGKSISTRAPLCPFCGTENRDASHVDDIPEAVPASSTGGTGDHRAQPGRTVTAFCDHAAVAEEAIVEFAGAGVNLDYSAASAASLDIAISDRFGASGIAPDDPRWKPDEDSRRLIALVGSYIGEVIRARVGGGWVDDPDNPGKPLFVRLDIGDGAIIWPLERAYRRLRQGERESLLGYIELVDREVRHAPNRAEDAMGWTGQASDFVKVGRVGVAQWFLDRAIELAPNLPEAWFMRGVVQEKNGHATDARYAYERAIEFGDTGDARLRTHLENKIARLAAQASSGGLGLAAEAAAMPWGSGAFPALAAPPDAPHRGADGAVPAPIQSSARPSTGAQLAGGFRMRQSESQQGAATTGAARDDLPLVAPRLPDSGGPGAPTERALVPVSDELEFDSDISAAFEAPAAPAPEPAPAPAPEPEPRRSAGEPRVATPSVPDEFAADADDGAALTQDARQLAAWGRFEEAVVCYRQALVISPSLDAARMGLAIACLTLGRPDEAVDVLAPLVATSYRPAVLLQSRALCGMGQLHEALALLDGFTTANDESFEFLRARGNTLLSLGRWADAADAFARAIQRNVDDARSWLGLATAAAHAGDDRRARLAYSAYRGLEHPAVEASIRFAHEALETPDSQ